MSADRIAPAAPALTKDAAIAAVELAAFTTGEGRDIIHCLSGTLGVDWDLGHAVDVIRAAAYVEWVDGFAGHELAVHAANGRTYLFGVKRPVPVVDPDPADADVDDFQVTADRDGDQHLRCAHYGRGCWWETAVGFEGVDDTLGALRTAARDHLAADHRRVLDVEPGGA